MKKRTTLIVSLFLKAILSGTIVSFAIGLLLAYPMCMMNLGHKVSSDLLGILLIVFSSIVGYGVAISSAVEVYKEIVEAE